MENVIDQLKFHFILPLDGRIFTYILFAGTNESYFVSKKGINTFLSINDSSY